MYFKSSLLQWRVKRFARKANIIDSGYSQYGQDIHVSKILKGAGTFIDIGANDGITFSNSLLFEEKGWSGICVEPHPNVFKSLSANRQCTCINACIGAEDCEVDFLAIEGPSHMLSGIESYLDERHLERINREIAERGGSKERIKIKCLSPKSLLDLLDFPKVSFLSLDTEGCELSILKAFIQADIRPSVLSVENGTRSPENFKFLSKSGYTLVKSVGCDEIYSLD